MYSNGRGRLLADQAELVGGYLGAVGAGASRQSLEEVRGWLGVVTGQVGAWRVALPCLSEERPLAAG